MNTPSRSQVLESDSWNLNSLFSDIEQWQAELTKATSQVEKLNSLAPDFLNDANSFETTLREFLELSKQIEKIYCYCALLSDQDTANSQNFGYKNQALALYTQFAATSSFLRPAIISLESKTLESYLNDENSDLHRMIEEIARFKPHTLSDAEELILAQAGEVFGSSQMIFSQLTNADLKFEPVEVDGQLKELTQGSFITFLKSSNREVRKKAWTNFYQAISNNENTLSTVLASSVKKNCFLAQARKFNSPREQALFSYNIPISVYDSLITNISETLTPLHKYYQLRKTNLKLKQLELYDSYVPIVEDPEVIIPYDEACQILSEAFQPLGSDYCEVLYEGLTDQRWVDRYENKGKRSGAYAMPCYSSHPYMLMNYKDSQLNQLFTLAHEAGHAMHTYYSQNNQSYQDYSYTIFVAEVASTLNEQLLLDYLQKKYSNDQKMLSYLVNHQIEDIKATYYRQTMFAEFEKQIHEDCQSGIPLTLDYFRSSYRKLLEKYFGSSMNIEKLAELECLRIPHFFSAFYVYQYATGLTAAVSLAEPIMAGNGPATERYLNFLKSGGSKYSLDLLKDAGVDLESPEPFEKIASLFQSQLEKLASI